MNINFHSILKRSTSGASRGDGSQATGATAAVTAAAAAAPTTAAAAAAQEEDPSGSSAADPQHQQQQSRTETLDGVSDSASLQEAGAAAAAAAAAGAGAGAGFSLGQKPRPVIVGLAPKGDSLDVKDFVDIKQLEGLFRAYVMLAIVKVFIFLDAFSLLCKRGCPSVSPLLGPCVRQLIHCSVRPFVLRSQMSYI